MKHDSSKGSNLEHLIRLRRHSAKLKVNGDLIDIPEDIWEKSMSECAEKGYNAVMYEMTIPETDDPMALCIWADGHVDSGAERDVIECMAQF